MRINNYIMFLMGLLIMVFGGIGTYNIWSNPFPENASALIIIPILAAPAFCLSGLFPIIESIEFSESKLKEGE
jgi:hypothetical protein